MDTEQRINVVEKLLTKAINTEDAIKAFHFTQAACNAANALRTLIEIKENL